MQESSTIHQPFSNQRFTDMSARTLNGTVGPSLQKPNADKQCVDDDAAMTVLAEVCASATPLVESVEIPYYTYRHQIWHSSASNSQALAYSDAIVYRSAIHPSKLHHHVYWNTFKVEYCTVQL